MMAIAVPSPTFLREHHTFRENVDCVKFSPTGEFLAAGSHDNHIDIFSMIKRNFSPVRRLRGHTRCARIFFFFWNPNHCKNLQIILSLVQCESMHIL